MKSFMWPAKALGGTKVYKEYLTILLTCSAVGKEEKLWLVSKAKLPHSFPQDASNLQKHCIYRHYLKVLMISSVFIGYLNWLNNKILMWQWKILLFMDSCQSDILAHPVQCGHTIFCWRTPPQGFSHWTRASLPHWKGLRLRTWWMTSPSPWKHL